MAGYGRWPLDALARELAFTLVRCGPAEGWPLHSRQVPLESTGRPASDYDRACDVDDYVGILQVGSGKGIVLGQDPLPATCQALPNGGLLIARLYTSEIGTPS